MRVGKNLRSHCSHSTFFYCMNMISATKVKSIPFETTMKYYSAWSMALALTMMAYVFVVFQSESLQSAEPIYVMCVALFHAIYGIWFFKGKKSPTFAAKTVLGRGILGIFLFMTAFFTRSIDESQPSQVIWLNLVFYYAMVIGSIELLSALITKMALNKDTYQKVQQELAPMTFKSKNRFVFGLYLLLLGALILINTNTLLQFFYLPETSFSGFTSERISFGPMHIVGVQILILGGYNLFAARNNVETLIEAGMRGGSITVLFFIILVTAGILHPITLLLPSIDFISMILIATNKYFQKQN